jgi:pseudouridine kinase
MPAVKTGTTRVFVIGGANIDILGQSAAAFRLGDSNPGRIGATFGGVGRNVAEACLRLGLELSLITVFGGDADGERMEADCRAKGMDTSLSMRWGGPSAKYVCALDADGALVGAVADMKALDALLPGHLEAAVEDLDGASCIVADANIPAESLAWLCGRYGRKSGTFKRGGKPLLFLDTVSEAKALKALGLFGEFDCIKPNMKEALVMASSPPRTESLERDSRAILPEDGEAEPGEIKRRIEVQGSLPGELYISLGPKGMYYSAQNEEGIVPLPPEALRPAVRNRSGAGDCALAGLVWASLRGYKPREKVYCALSAALLSAASASPVPEDLGEGKLLGLAAQIAEKGLES